ncbi:hypothetical protein DMENIID0001_026100 [Sergentomyia squamirostris]
MDSGSSNKKVSFKRQKVVKSEAESTSDELEKKPKKKLKVEKHESSSGSPADPERQTSSDEKKSSSEEERKVHVRKESPRKSDSQTVVPDSERMQDFLVNQSNLNLYTPSRVCPDIKIYPEEDVFILQCHKSVEIEKLIGQKISMKGSTKIEDQGLNFIIERLPQEKPKTVTLISSQEKGQLAAETFPVAGTIKIDQILEENQISYTATQDNAPEAFPTNLKVRHPLLGVNYEEKLAEVAQIFVKEEPEEEKSPRKKSKKKRKHEEDSSPTKVSPSKKKIKQEKDISDDLQWIQNV